MLFNVLNCKNCQPRVLYTVKKQFIFSDKPNSEFSTSRSSLKQASEQNKNNVKDVFKQKKFMPIQPERFKKK